MKSLYVDDRRHRSHYITFLVFLLIVTSPMTVFSYYTSGFTLQLTILIAILTVPITFVGLSRRVFLFRKIDIYFAVLILWSTLSSLAGIDVAEGFKLTIQLILLTYCFWLVREAVAREETSLSTALNAFWVGGVIQAAVSVVELGFGFRFVDPLSPIERVLRYSPAMSKEMTDWLVQVGNHILPRVRGLENDPSLLAGFVLIFISLSFADFVFGSDRKRRTRGLIFTILGVMEIVFTYSRSAWFGLYLGTFISLLLLLRHKQVGRLDRKRISLLLITSALVVPGIALLNPFHLMGRIMQTFQTQNVSTAGHLKFAEDAIRIFSAHPWIGVGPGNFKNALGTNAMAHDMYLTFLSEQGIVGLLLNVGLYVIMIKLAHDLIKQERTVFNYVGLVGIMSVTDIMCANIGYDYHNQYYIFALFGIIAGAKTLSSVTNKKVDDIDLQPADH